jgi:hypothetical protein
MYLSGRTHRDQLFDLAARWLADRVDPEDGRILSEIFAFERAITAPTVRRFVTDLCRVRKPRGLYLERVASKDATREAIVAAATYPTMRVAELISWYRQLPEEYFPRTPVHMSLITRGNGKLVGMVRRKRIRRIADKVSRRVRAQLLDEITALAASLAASRPRGSRLAVAKDESPAGIPRGVSGAAERLVADRIRSGRLTLDPDSQRVDDVIGVKVIGTEDELAAVEAVLDDLEYTWAFHREVHDGSYVGTHYLVDLELPPVESILASMEGVNWSFADGRGLDPADREDSFQKYVVEASRTFRVELILTTFEDLVESEFGDCIHEQRILEQRGLSSTFDRIPTNASSIIEFMLHLAMSPTVRIDELPIKIWGRYVRDTVVHVIQSLDGAGPAEWLIPNPNGGELITL